MIDNNQKKLKIINDSTNEIKGILMKLFIKFMIIPLIKFSKRMIKAIIIFTIVAT